MTIPITADICTGYLLLILLLLPFKPGHRITIAITITADIWRDYYYY